MLGFAVDPVIEGVEDFHYRTGALLKAHSHYFVQATHFMPRSPRAYTGKAAESSINETGQADAEIIRSAAR